MVLENCFSNRKCGPRPGKLHFVGLNSSLDRSYALEAFSLDLEKLIKSVDH